MIRSFDRPVHVTYCANVHPGESWEETFAGLRAHSPAVKARVSPDRHFGLGLRLSDQASREILEPGRMDRFKAFLAAENLYVFTMNGFPFGRFHGVRVKEAVYEPDWSSPGRLAYTARLASIMAELVPPGEEGSVSTSPLGFKEAFRGADHLKAMVQNLALAALAFERSSLRSGRNLHLGLEPEPLCLLETSEEAVEFFERELWPAGSAFLANEAGTSRGEAEALLRRRIGVCHDACHAAVEFEDAGEAFRHYRRAGILVSKVQISSALKLTPSPSALKELERFSGAVYLHQTIGRRRDGSLVRWRDIGPALAARRELEACPEARVHCHVPLYLEKHGELGATSDHVAELLAAARGERAISHFELETYTWSVLPEELRSMSLDDALAAEFAWFLPLLESAAGGAP